jgi:hypothetical protein
MITQQRSRLKLRLARGVRYALALHSAGNARNPSVAEAWVEQNYCA